MRDDPPAAALRLSASCTVRTHERKPEQKISRQLRHYYDRKAKNPGVGKGGSQGHAVIINGQTFKTMKAAKETFGIGNSTFYSWLDSGKAKRK